MKYSRSGAELHLTCCLNAYPADTLDDLELTIKTHACTIASNVGEKTGYKGAFGLGLWIGAQNAKELVGNSARLEQLRVLLEDNNFYVFSLNGFPHGTFHGKRVKTDVYLPDWSSSQRLEYTCQLAEILATLLPVGMLGSISTLPVAYGANATKEKTQEAIVALGKMALYLEQLEQRSGKCIVLAIEPEPDCLLDSESNTREFFLSQLYPEIASGSRYIGLCLDTVHTALAFEDAGETLRSWCKAGIPVFKIQTGAALCSDSLAPLMPFDEEVYLHQTRLKERDGTIRRYSDLSKATASDGQWRVHFHLPLAKKLEPPLYSSAQDVSPDFLAEAVSSGVKCLEVEIYTLDVSPDMKDASKATILADDICHLWHNLP